AIDVQTGQSAAGEEVEETERATLQRLEEFGEGSRIRARRRYVRAQPVDREQTERVQDAFAQVLDCPDVANGLDEIHCWISWQEPPPASMCFRAASEKLWACTVSFFGSL